MLGPDRLGTVLHFRRLAVPVHLPEQGGVVLHDSGKPGMLSSEQFLINFMQRKRRLA